MLVLDASDIGTEALDADLPSWMRSVGRAVATSHLTVINKADLVGEAHKSRLKEKGI